MVTEQWTSFIESTKGVNDRVTLSERCETLTIKRDRSAGTVEIFHEGRCIYRALQVDRKCWLVRAVKTNYRED